MYDSVVFRVVTELHAPHPSKKPCTHQQPLLTPPPPAPGNQYSAFCVYTAGKQQGQLEQGESRALSRPEFCCSVNPDLCKVGLLAGE